MTQQQLFEQLLSEDGYEGYRVRYEEWNKVYVPEHHGRARYKVVRGKKDVLRRQIAAGDRARIEYKTAKKACHQFFQ